MWGWQDRQAYVDSYRDTQYGSHLAALANAELARINKAEKDRLERLAWERSQARF